MKQEQINTVLEAEKHFFDLMTRRKVTFNSYSVGYHRLRSLPEETQNKANIACAVYQKTTTELCEFLGSLTEMEFLNWLKVN